MRNVKKIVMIAAFLPDEIIFEILSWLPVESLLKLKCVCKMWCSIIENPKFINMHMSRARDIFGIASDEKPGFSPMYYRHGLRLMKRTLTKAYRLRNLATRQVLDLPSPPDQTGICCANTCYIPTSNEFKLVYMNYAEKKRNTYAIVYHVLRVGSDLTWKRLDSPFLCESTTNWPARLAVGMVLYSFKRRLTGDYVLDCVDLENDQIKSIIISHNHFPTGGLVRLLEWKGKLSLASVEQEKLNVWILESYEKHQWTIRKLIIPLTFIKCYPSMSSRYIEPYAVQGSRLLWYFHNQDHHAIFSFDIESKKVKFHAASSRQTNLCHYRPSLLHFKGMRPESTNVGGKIELCDNADDIFIRSTT